MVKRKLIKLIKNKTNVRNTCKMLLVLEAKEPFFKRYYELKQTSKISQRLD